VISGSFLSEAHTNGQLVECKFFFSTNKPSAKKGEYSITAWEKNEFFHVQSKGRLYIKNDDWRIQIKFPSEGCKRYPWSTFSSDKQEAQTFSVFEKSSVFGLHVLKGGANYYKKITNDFERITSPPSFLKKDDLIASIKIQGDFTYIEHFSWQSRKQESSGWIRSEDIGAPISRAIRN
jgi:hypothetical protein